MPMVYVEPKKWENKKEIKVISFNEETKEKIHGAIDEIPYVAEAKLVVKAKGQKKYELPFSSMGNRQYELFKKIVDKMLSDIPKGTKKIKVTIFWNKDVISKMEDEILTKKLP